MLGRARLVRLRVADARDSEHALRRLAKGSGASVSRSSRGERSDRSVSSVIFRAGDPGEVDSFYFFSLGDPFQMLLGPSLLKKVKDGVPCLSFFLAGMRESEAQSESSVAAEMETIEAPHGKSQSRLLLALNCAMLSVGTCGAPLLMRLYFVHGGARVWLISWLEMGGWPIIILPLAVAYFRRRSTEGPSAHLVLMDTFLFAASAVIGVLMGLDNYLYAYGVARLPVSTSSLLIATQLAFTAGFAFLLVRQLFTSYSINSIFLLTIGAGVLGMHASSDRPAGESDGEYYAGFFMTLGAAALYGFVLPLVELTYKKAKQAVTYTLVLEIQLVMCFFATAFCTVGMLVNKDFQAIPAEARNYELGEARYYVVLVWNAIICQFFFLGAIGVIFYASSLFSGIIISVCLPVTEVLAVIFFQEKFQAEKGVSLTLSLWGFASYFYGELKFANKKKKEQRQLRPPETEMRQQGLP